MRLHWDSTYAIVLDLKEHYPKTDVTGIGLQELHQMIISLPTFDDDPELADDALLTAILGEWYEEANS